LRFDFGKPGRRRWSGGRYCCRKAGSSFSYSDRLFPEAAMFIESCSQ